jgi:hypothetical protein
MHVDITSTDTGTRTTEYGTRIFLQGKLTKEDGQCCGAASFFCGSG